LADAFNQILSVVLPLAEKVEITQRQVADIQITPPIDMPSKEQVAIFEHYGGHMLLDQVSVPQSRSNFSNLDQLRQNSAQALIDNMVEGMHRVAAIFCCGSGQEEQTFI
jgi:hypothetical protein